MNKNSYRGHQAYRRPMGEAAKSPSGRSRPGQAAAVVKVLGDAAGAHPGHPSEPSGIVYDRMSEGVRLDEVERSSVLRPLLVGTPGSGDALSWHLRRWGQGLPVRLLVDLERAGINNQ